MKKLILTLTLVSLLTVSLGGAAFAQSRQEPLSQTSAETVQGSVPAQAEVDMSILSGETERALIKQIAQFCEEIKLSARDYDPSHINRYLQELAGCFHRFYTACRIKGEEPAVRSARLKLADETRMVLKNGLKLIGVDAPEKM